MTFFNQKVFIFVGEAGGCRAECWCFNIRNICVTHKNKHNAIYITDISGLTLQGFLTENLLSRHGLPLAFVNVASGMGHSWGEQRS